MAPHGQHMAATGCIDGYRRRQDAGGGDGGGGEGAGRAREVVATAAAQGGRRRRGHALHVLGEGGQLDVEALARARGCDHDAVVAVLLGAHVLRLRVVQWPESRREAAHEPVMEATHVFLLGRRARRA